MDYRFKKTSWIGSNYEIKKQGRVVGRYCDNELKQLAKASLGDKCIRLKIKNEWKPRMEIINQSDNKSLGVVRFGSFSSKATITLNGKKFLWQTSGLFGNKWKILEGKNQVMSFEGNECSGAILDVSNNEILILTGLSIKNYINNRNTVFIVVAIFMPLMYALGG